MRDSNGRLVRRRISASGKVLQKEARRRTVLEGEWSEQFEGLIINFPQWSHFLLSIVAFQDPGRTGESTSLLH